MEFWQNLDLDGKNLYAAGYYIDSYPNGTQYATYWLNGKRIVLGEGEISDIEVKDGVVYATGYDENWDAVYWVDGVKKTLEGDDTHAHSIFVKNVGTKIKNPSSRGWKVERETRLELATFWMATRCSTN